MRHTPPRSPRLTPAVFLLRDSGLTLQQIAHQFGVTKVAVSQYLRRARTRFNQPSIERACTYCNKPGWYSKSNNPNTAYCSRTCYFASLSEHPYQENRHGQRLARLTIEEVYGQIPHGAVAHHVNGDCTDNKFTNLVLFISQADHLKHHRDYPHDPPLWSGHPLTCNHTMG